MKLTDNLKKQVKKGEKKSHIENAGMQLSDDDVHICQSDKQFLYP